MTQRNEQPLTPGNIRKIPPNTDITIASMKEFKENFFKKETHFQRRDLRKHILHRQQHDFFKTRHNCYFSKHFS